jgi:hypothetical protein
MGRVARSAGWGLSHVTSEFEEAPHPSRSSLNACFDPPSPLRRCAAWGREKTSALKLKNKKSAGLITQAGVLLLHTDRRSGADQSSFLSTFQNIGIAAPLVMPVSDLRQMLGTLYSPSGM